MNEFKCHRNVVQKMWKYQYKIKGFNSNIIYDVAFFFLRFLRYWLW